MRDLAIAALVPSANDAATALAVYVGQRLDPALRRDDEREGARARPHRDPLREPARARSAGPCLERPRRDDAARRPRSATRSSARGRRGRRRRSPAAARSTSTDDLLGTLPLDRRQDRATRTTPAGRRWRPSSADGVRITASVLGAPSEAQRNADLGGLLAWGLAQYHPRQGRRRRRVYGLAETGYGAPPVKLVAPRESSARCGSGSRSSSASSSARRSPLPVARGQQVGEVRVFAGGRLIARTPLVAADVGFGRRHGGEGRVVRPPHRPPSRRVSSRERSTRHRRKGRSCDRHRHPQRRARPLAHRPDLQARAPAPGEQRARARGRQGHQRGARAQAARRARRRDRPRRRPHGDADRRGADGGGDPQRLRPDPGRVAHVDGRRRPDLGHLHRDQRVGPEGLAGRARDPARQAPLPLAAAPRRWCSPARCRAASTRASTPTRSAR